MFNDMLEYFKKLAYEEYELTVWFDGGSSEDKEGNLTPNPKSKKVFKLKSVSKKTPTHIKGKELDGTDFEIRTVQPFDYMLRIIY